MAVLLFAVNCDNATDERGTSIAYDNQIDTLCVYDMMSSGTYERRVFKNEAEIVSFLDSTGYDEKNETVTLKKIKHQLDFKEWTYFVLAGHNYPRESWSVLEGKDTVTISYIEYSMIPPCDGGDCRIYAPPSRRAFIFFIPFTQKAVDFVDTKKTIPEYYSRFK